VSGYSVTTNALGIRAIRVHYSASAEKNVLSTDPEVAKRAAAWYDSARLIYPDPNQWAQEMEINWWMAAGTRVYPEFSETLHTKPIEYFQSRKVIYRAWDFGWHAPVCLIAQIDEKDRLTVLREIVGKQQTTREFAEQVISKCAQWFQGDSKLMRTAGYQDFCDPAGQKVSANGSEHSEVRDVEVLNKLAIHPSWEYGWSRKDGRSLVHQLLAQRIDGTPSMYVSATDCPVLLQGFLGKYVYPARKGGTAHDEPDENSHPWADAHAALRYLCTGLFTALGLKRQSASVTQLPPVHHHGYGTPLRPRRRAHA
jgi:hypothetical protein